jgi:hypothetical protein
VEKIHLEGGITPPILYRWKKSQKKCGVIPTPYKWRKILWGYSWSPYKLLTASLISKSPDLIK